MDKKDKDAAEKLIANQLEKREQMARSVIAGTLGRLMVDMLLQGKVVTLETLEAEARDRLVKASGDAATERSVMAAVAILKDGRDPTKPGALT